MRLSGLSLEQAPPMSVPFRFFLTAPLYGIAAAIILFLDGGDNIFARWSGTTIAVVHLMMLGFAGNIMFGAMEQMLPVVAGSPVRWPRLTAFLVHTFWNIGAIMLPIGFLTDKKGMLMGGKGMLLTAALIFVLSSFDSLFRSPVKNETTLAMKFAVFSLGVVVTLGVFLVLWRLGHFGLGRPLLTDLHLRWGLFGWVSLLIMGIAYQVVPMFQLTPLYGRAVRKAMAPLLFLFLTLELVLFFTIREKPIFGTISAVIDFGIAAILVFFAGYTIWLQGRRRRKVWDVTLYFWRLGLIALIVAAGIWAAGQVFEPVRMHPHFSTIIGGLFIFGFVIPIIIGMIYKIIPFLVWFHLQGFHTERIKAGLPREKVPKMKDVISDTAGKVQFIAFLVAVVLVVVTAIFPEKFLFYPAVAAVLFSFIWLEWEFIYSVFVYFSHPYIKNKSEKIEKKSEQAPAA